MHRLIAQCKRGAEIKLWCLAEEEEQEVTFRAFRAYGRLLDMVTSFQYLGRVISAAGDAVVRNLTRVRAVWKRIHSWA